MEKKKRITADIDPLKHEKIKIAVIKEKTDISEAVRAFFDALIRGDPRAISIIQDAKKK